MANEKSNKIKKDFDSKEKMEFVDKAFKRCNKENSRQSSRKFLVKIDKY